MSLKIKTIVALTLLLVLSCKTGRVKKNTGTPKFNIANQWLLKQISFEDQNKFDEVQLLNDVTNRCLKDSIWEFNTTTNSGNYSINDLNCAYGYRNLTFKILHNSAKLGSTLLILNTENKAKLITSHTFKVENYSDTNMQWKYLLTVNGKQEVLNLFFEKQI